MVSEQFVFDTIGIKKIRVLTINNPLKLKSKFRSSYFSFINKSGTLRLAAIKTHKKILLLRR